MDAYERSKSHASHWMGDTSSAFIIDGIDLSNLEEPKVSENKFIHIVKRELAFIERIKEQCL